MQPYQSELFRFVTQRPIQQIKSDQLKRRIVPCYMEPPPTNSWYARMLRLRQRPDPYERMLQEAVKLINETSEETNESYSGNFVRRLFDKLEFPIWKYAEELWTRNPLLNNFKGTKELIYQLIEDINENSGKFSIKDITQFTKLDQFKRCWTQMGDGLIAIVIDNRRFHKNSDYLIQIIRFMGLIKRMASLEDICTESDEIPDGCQTGCSKYFPWIGNYQNMSGPDNKIKLSSKQKLIIAKKNWQKEQLDCEGAIQEIFKSVIGLPDELFPIPRPVSPPQIKTKPAIGTKVSLEKYLDLKSSLKELKALGSEDFEISTEKDQPDSVKPSWLLNDKILKKLSKQTKSAFNYLNLDPKKQSLPEMLNLLESAISKVKREAFQTGTPEKTLQYGNSRIHFKTGDEKTESALLLSNHEADIGYGHFLGTGDLMVVKQSLLGYEMGEIAHIENVLIGEHKERVHRRSKTVEEEITEETERTETSERDLQSTERFELKKELSELLKEDHKVEVKANYGGSWKGSMGVGELTQNWGLNAGYNYQHSKEESQKISSTYAKDITERALSKMEEKIREERRQKSIETIEETNTHGIDNRGAKNHVTGIYRWVDKRYQAQVMNYGERSMYEFIIPEPSAFYLYSLQNKPEIISKPSPPMVKEVTVGDETVIVPAEAYEEGARPLLPGDIDPEDYDLWVSKYELGSMKAPPVKYKMKSLAETIEKGENEQEDNAILKSITIEDFPKGYKAKLFHVWGHSEEEFADVVDNFILPLRTRNFQSYEAEVNKKKYKVWHIIGAINSTKEFEIANIVDAWRDDTGWMRYTPRWTTYGNWSILSNHYPQDELTISLAAHNVEKVIFNARFWFERSEELVKAWQQEAYDSILQAYIQLKSQYDEQLAAAAIQEGISISGRNPYENRKLEETELKKAIISLLKTENFGGFELMTHQDEVPGFNFGVIREKGKEIQFLEQAFDWANITYRFYPYFWAWNGEQKDASGQVQERFGTSWVEKLTLIQDTDPLFEQFLKAGAARVILPVRPGYERALIYFATEGKPWEGGDPPVIDDDLYVSIVNEIMEGHGIYFHKDGGYLRVENDSLEAYGSGTDFQQDDLQREIIIEGQSYHVAQVHSSTWLTLNKAYQGPNNERARYFIGAKQVGAPWQLSVPTSLIKLQSDNTLP